ncbi:hypothetical protein [Microbacterium paulum]
MNEQQTINHETRAERPEPPTTSAPEAAGAVERSAFAVHRDPSLNSGASRGRVGRGIEWVRPSDLIASGSARVVGRGLDLQTELARQARRAPGRAIRAGRDGVRAVRERAASRPRTERGMVREVEPDVFDIGYRRSSSWVRASGIGLG